MEAKPVSRSVKRGALVGVLLLALLLITILPAAAITWGERDTTHTNVGAMVVDYPDYGLWQTCSGTLIHPKVFLTAGHCTDGWSDEELANMYVNFHEYALNPDTLHKVEAVITHPEYAWGGSNPHDIGVLILEEPITDIVPAPLPPAGFLDELKAAGELRDKSQGALFTLVGYGGTLAWPPPEITYEDYRQFAYSEYKSLTQVWLHMSQSANQDNGGTCFGDSGGPAFWEMADGTEVVVGVTSWGDAQCVATSFNYRVDLQDSLDFIAENTP